MSNQLQAPWDSMGIDDNPMGHAVSRFIEPVFGTFVLQCNTQTLTMFSEFRAFRFKAGISFSDLSLDAFDQVIWEIRCLFRLRASIVVLGRVGMRGPYPKA